ncbi:MAG: efflux RND transporter periplasmic adaptor subunit [Planctomycetota bacterium JB042]
MAIEKSTKWRIAVAVLLSLAFLVVARAAFLALASLKRPPVRVEQEIPRAAVRCVRVTRGPFRETLVGYGRARALRTTEVAAEVTGTVVWIAPGLEAGTSVAEGDELVRLDPRDHEQEVARTAADLAQAEAVRRRRELELVAVGEQLEVSREELAVAEGELERAEALSGDDTLSQQERDERRRLRSSLTRNVLQLEWRAREVTATLDADRAAEARAAAALARARIDLERCTVRAPYDARVRERFAEPGGRVAPGTVLLSLVDASTVEIPIELPASRFGEVEYGAAAQVRLREDGDVRWSGRVRRVAPEVDAETRTFEAYLEIENDPGRPAVPPGAFVLAAVEGLLHENVVVVPRVAFVGDLVYVAERMSSESGEAVAVRRTPTVRRSLADWALVDGGLAAGDEVIVTNLEQIADESRIHVTASETLRFPRATLDTGDSDEAGDAAGSSR